MVQSAEKCAAKVRPTARGVYEDDIEEIEENVLPKKVKKKLHSAQQDWFEKLKAFQLPSAKCSVLHGSLGWLREEAQGWRILWYLHGLWSSSQEGSGEDVDVGGVEGWRTQAGDQREIYIYTTRKWLSQMRTYPRKSYSYVMSKHTLGGLGPLLLCHHNKP